MKEFILIFRGPRPGEMNLTPEQHQAMTQKWMNWVGKLVAEGRFGGGNPLSIEGKILKGQQPMLTDGPFAEGKEYLGGYLILKAQSLEEASQVAYGFPDFERGGSVEIREIQPMM